MVLVDTNIFLEILLGQKKKDVCKKFLSDNISDLQITDFSLHSIGVILFRFGKEEIFRKFVEDIMPNFELLSLPADMYADVVEAKGNLNLDFDDAYQYAVAKYYKLEIVTMDQDFRKIKDVKIIFL